MKPWPDVCKQGPHCETCRDLDGGRAWRQALTAVYSLPGGVDFLCPHGRPWGFVDPAPRPTMRIKTPAALPDCVHRRDTGRKVLHTCCGGRTREDVLYLCALTGQEAPCRTCKTPAPPPIPANP